MIQRLIERRGRFTRVPMYAAVIAVLSVCLTGSNIQAEESGNHDEIGKRRSSGTVAMAATLSRIIADAWPPERYYTIGFEDRIKRLEERLAKASQAKDVGKQISLRVQIAFEQLKQGETEKAIDGLTVVLTFFEQAEFRATPQSKSLLTNLMATAYLRLGEQANCLSRHGPDSCLLPIRGDGVHRDKRGSTAATAELMKLLSVDPENVAARWLLNIAHMTLGTYPEDVPEAHRIDPGVFTSSYDIKRFRNVATAAGVDIPGLGGGVVMDDFDRDGELDLMVSSWGLTDNIRLLINKGDGTFDDRTDEAGLAGLTGGINLTHADFDNDGYLDVYVCRGAWLRENGLHPNSLLRNNGDGTFSDVTRSAGVFSLHPSHSACWADFNLDGWVDLFVANESSRDGDHPSQLYRNNGDGTFTDVAEVAGVQIKAFTKGAAWGDIDNDGLPDLYLSNLMQPNVLFRNLGAKGDWKFELAGKRAGVSGHKPSFPTWFWDYDNDGHLDIFVAPFPGFLSDSLGQIAGGYLGAPNAGLAPALFHNNGDGTFSNVASNIGLTDMMLVMGANYGDLDNDGYPDIYLGTGEPSLNTLVPNRMYRNAGGESFQNVTFSGGFGHLQKGHGIAFGDIDHDGDQDVYAVMGGAYAGDIAYNALYINPGHDHAWLTLQLEGTDANRSAIGARIRVDVEDANGSKHTVHQLVHSGGSFGASTLQQEIGLGNATEVRAVTIQWPGDDTPQVFRDVPINRSLAVKQGERAYHDVTRPRVIFPTE